LPQIKAYLFAYQHMSEQTQLTGSGAIKEYVEQVGCLQYDPLNVVGRNPDLVLQSRIPHYEIGDINESLYTKRELFDVWDKNMSICCVDDWPHFSHHRERYIEWCSRYPSEIEEIRQYLSENDSACSSDIEMEHKVDWHWGPQRFAKAALEAMCYAGLAIVHHKNNTRRYYGLAERYIPKEMFSQADPFATPAQYYEWAVNRRINSVGLLWNKASDAWLGIRGLKSGERNTAFADLLDKNKIVPVHVEGIDIPLYIAVQNIPLLMADNPEHSDTMRILAPLDNMLWDRKLIKALFDFDYKWEVYTPVAQRKYGYYVLPLTMGAEFVGRIEFEKKQNLMGVKNVWYEEDVNVDAAFAQKLDDCIYRFMRYLKQKKQ